GYTTCDSSGRVFGVHSGLNNDPSFQTDVKGAAVAMEEARAKVSLSGEQGVHRCGKYKTLTTGNSHGDGQMQPGVLVNGIISTGVLCALLPLGIHSLCRGSPALIGLFVNWAPNLFDFYTVYTQDFYKTYKHFRRPFLNSVFSACTFNLGPYTCALGHRKGGHLILWDCKLILEFPPGTTILIPSAAIFHSNIPISKGEHRYSFTQYTAGGIFRWVDHGYQTEEEYWDSLSAADRKVERANGLERASQGVNLFSTLAELRAMASQLLLYYSFTECHRCHGMHFVIS
ncbi:hypothetical protein C8R47DRAFT_985448, partial [Mycena vitilis]